MQSFEITVILADALGSDVLPECPGADIAFGRSGFLIARFSQGEGESLGNAVARAISDLAVAVTDGGIVKIEFSNDAWVAG